MDIGTLLRRFRDKQKLTSRTIAEKIGISHSTYMDWEHNKSSPSLKSYIKLSNAFGVSPVDLLAYLLGQSGDVQSEEEKTKLADLKEMVIYYRNYANMLKEQIKMIESELHKTRQFLK